MLVSVIASGILASCDRSANSPSAVATAKVSGTLAAQANVAWRATAAANAAIGTAAAVATADTMATQTSVAQQTAVVADAATDPVDLTAQVVEVPITATEMQPYIAGAIARFEEASELLRLLREDNPGLYRSVGINDPNAMRNPAWLGRVQPRSSRLRELGSELWQYPDAPDGSRRLRETITSPGYEVYVLAGRIIQAIDSNDWRAYDGLANGMRSTRERLAQIRRQLGELQPQ
jgi:hypothetical protein